MRVAIQNDRKADGFSLHPEGMGRGTGCPDSGPFPVACRNASRADATVFGAAREKPRVRTCGRMRGSPGTGIMPRAIPLEVRRSAPVRFPPRSAFPAVARPETAFYTATTTKSRPLTGKTVFPGRKQCFPVKTYTCVPRRRPPSRTFLRAVFKGPRHGPTRCVPAAWNPCIRFRTRLQCYPHVKSCVFRHLPCSLSARKRN